MGGVGVGPPKNAHRSTSLAPTWLAAHTGRRRHPLCKKKQSPGKIRCSRFGQTKIGVSDSAEPTMVGHEADTGCADCNGEGVVHVQVAFLAVSGIAWRFWAVSDWSAAAKGDGWMGVLYMRVLCGFSIA